MLKRLIHKGIVLAGLFIYMLALTACTTTNEQVVIPEETGGFIKIAPGAYDSADTAIVISKQESQKKITFMNLEKKKTYTLNYDGITEFKDKYGTQISVSQLKEGEMVDLFFLKGEKLLSSVTVSSEIWTFNDVTKFELDLSAGRMKIMDEYYTLEESTVVISQGEQKEFIDINSQDILQIKGIDHKIYSIVIEEGHGYLRLKNDEYFIGGWIEVGQKIIQKIEENMLLAVPEGTYEVYLSHSGIEGIKEVKITRNKETTLDVGDLKKEDLIKYGNLVFTIEPSDAEVLLDGKKVDINRIVKAEYGLHQIMVKAEGYDTVIQYIRVNETNANISISLDEEKEHSVSENTTGSTTTTNDTTKKEDTTTESVAKTDKKEETDSKVDSNTESKTEEQNNKKENTDDKEGDEDKKISSTTTESSITGYKVTIESPEGAEIYIDGNYVGIAPVSYKKKSGTQEVTIRKTGYVTRTYTIDVDDEQKDISYSFSALTPIE